MRLPGGLADRLSWMKDTLVNMVQYAAIPTFGTAAAFNPATIPPNLAQTPQLPARSAGFINVETSPSATSFVLMCDAFFVELDTDTGHVETVDNIGKAYKWYHHWRVHVYRGRHKDNDDNEIWAHVRETQTLGFCDPTTLRVEYGPKKFTLQHETWMPLSTLRDQLFTYFFTTSVEIWPNPAYCKVDKGHRWFHRTYGFFNHASLIAQWRIVRWSPKVDVIANDPQQPQPPTAASVLKMQKWVKANRIVLTGGYHAVVA
ncbi:hypothetical protein BDV95DRAFT_603167 [Massariosphaeria phaeospora]|uniref:Uncharacterized protein n=1 Tax=Massariosphaeria phaeospora TaxID=100035 RepID=A0A7C8MV48_9PLEO|nr:hypothetical protein BDV95DRAFT_603167 [Massariosphaeria phaeospora]